MSRFFKIALATAFAGGGFAMAAGPITTVPWNGHVGAVSFTFDDGMQNQIDNLKPILDKMPDVTVTFFIPGFSSVWQNNPNDLAALAQSLPGVMAVNASILLGYRMAGIPGALTALSATILPPLITLSIIAQAYEAYAASPVVRLVLKGMQCGATALIVNVAVDLVRKQCKKRLAIPLVILVGTFVANFYFDVNLMLLVVMDGVLGLLLLRSPEYD